MKSFGGGSQVFPPGKFIMGGDRKELSKDRVALVDTPRHEVTLTLKQGENTLHFWRDKAPQYGVAVKSFTLKPTGGE